LEFNLRYHYSDFSIHHNVQKDLTNLISDGYFQYIGGLSKKLTTDFCLVIKLRMYRALQSHPLYAFIILCFTLSISYTHRWYASHSFIQTELFFSFSSPSPLAQQVSALVTNLVQIQDVPWFNISCKIVYHDLGYVSQSYPVPSYKCCRITCRYFMITSFQIFSCLT
jgi:hypothetical protein